MHGTTRLCRDFINHHVCSNKISNKVTAAASNANTTNAHVISHIGCHLFKTHSNRVNRFSLGVPVLFGHQLPVSIDKDDFGANGTDIDAQEDISAIA